MLDGWNVKKREWIWIRPKSSPSSQSLAFIPSHLIPYIRAYTNVVWMKAENGYWLLRSSHTFYRMEWTTTTTTVRFCKLQERVLPPLSNRRIQWMSTPSKNSTGIFIIAKNVCMNGIKRRCEKFEMCQSNIINSNTRIFLPSLSLGKFSAHVVVIQQRRLAYTRRKLPQKKAGIYYVYCLLFPSLSHHITSHSSPLITYIAYTT